jgi:hypothetical protein
MDKFTHSSLFSFRRVARLRAPRHGLSASAESAHTPLFTTMATAEVASAPPPPTPPPLASIVAAHRTRRAATPLHHTLIGGGAGVMEVCIMQPTVCVKNALQVSGVKMVGGRPAVPAAAAAGRV